jgi:hypothetical protein
VLFGASVSSLVNLGKLCLPKNLLLNFFSVPEIELRALHMQSICSATEQHLQPENLSVLSTF